MSSELSSDSNVGQGNGRVGPAPAAADGGSAGFLRRIAGAGVGGDRGQREHALVRESAGALPARAVDWRCGCDRPARGTEAEARPASRGADSEADVGESLSQDLGSECGGARLAAVADSSSASGVDADADQEPAAAHSLEPGLAEEAEAVEGGGGEGVSLACAVALVPAAARE